MNTIKYNRAHKELMVAMSNVPSAVEIPLSQITGTQWSELSSKEIVAVCKQINASYHTGKASAGAEIIDNDAIWINQNGGTMLVKRNGQWVDETINPAADAALIRARDAALGVGYTENQYQAWLQSYGANK